MASPFDHLADLAFSRILGVFGEEAEIGYRSGVTQLVSGIFVNASLMTDASGMGVSDFTSTFEIKCGDWNPPKKSDSLKLRGETYKIAEVERDTSGILKLYLQREKRIKSVKKN